MNGLSLTRQRGHENQGVLVRSEAMGATLAKNHPDRLKRLQALARQVADLEAQLDQILADLRTCEDPELENGLQADLVHLMDRHQAVIETMERVT